MEGIILAIESTAVHEKVKRKLLTLKMHHLSANNGIIAKTLYISWDSVTN
jgi:hypothetical protein